MKRGIVIGLTVGSVLAFMFAYFVIKKTITDSVLFTLVCVLLALTERGIKRAYRNYKNKNKA